MSQRIQSIETPDGPPYDTEVILTCEGDHGLTRAPAIAIFRARDYDGDYLKMRKAFPLFGWHKSGCRWLGPCCSKNVHPKETINGKSSTEA